MKSRKLDKLFTDELERMYSSENEISKSLPKLIELASFNELKDALSKHLNETKKQLIRIERIFSLIDLDIGKKQCKAMEGILHEAEELAKGNTKSAILDAAIIGAAQKVEHYEIASYTTLRSFAKYLELESEIVDLLQETLDEELAADKALTKIAEGTLFTTGVNKKAATNSHK